MSVIFCCITIHPKGSWLKRTNIQTSHDSVWICPTGLLVWAGVTRAGWPMAELPMCLVLRRLAGLGQKVSAETAPRGCHL